MFFCVKCVRCQRTAILKSVEFESADIADEAASKVVPRLDGYIIDCPACRERQRRARLPAPARTATCRPHFTRNVPRNVA
jgi:hypothetical protein